MDGADNRVRHEPIVVKKINTIKQHRSMTSAINRQPSLSYKKTKI